MQLSIPYRVSADAVIESRITNCVVTTLPLSIEDCDTNIVNLCPCIQYAEICDPNEPKCCPPLQCLRYKYNCYFELY